MPKKLTRKRQRLTGH